MSSERIKKYRQLIHRLIFFARVSLYIGVLVIGGVGCVFLAESLFGHFVFSGPVFVFGMVVTALVIWVATGRTSDYYLTDWADKWDTHP